MERTYRHGTRQIAVALQRGDAGGFTAQVGDHTHRVEAALLDATTVQLTVDGVGVMAQVVKVGETYHVAIAGETYLLAPVVGGSGADHPTVLATPQIVAPMPGKVLQVLVEAGNEVAAGDGLVILEAMKMEHRIVAEAAATVRAVHVSDGQMVDAGVVLVELDYPE